MTGKGVLLDVVVPCARPVQAVTPVLGALARAVSAAGLHASQVTVVDDRPRRRELEAVVSDHGFRSARTRGATGPGGARNAGLGGSAPWVLFCDDDVEVDTSAVARAVALAQDAGKSDVAVIGALRPPPDAPAWLVSAYRNLSAMTASAYAPPGPVPPTYLCGALLLTRRCALNAVGGFPVASIWEDAVLGLRLTALVPGGQVRRDLALSGVHHNVPDGLASWLERQRQAGRGLAALAGEVSEHEQRAVAAALHVERGWRAALKRAAARVPANWWVRVPGPLAFRLASSAAFMQGYHHRSPER